MTNESGIYPLEFKILVLPEQIETVTPSGLVKMTDKQADIEYLAQTDAVLVAVGSMAFYKWPISPAVGQQIKFSKYEGMMVKGVDGKMYRLINDKDVLAIIDKKES